MLQQLQAECGEAGDSVDNAASESVEASVERVRSFVDKTRAGMTTSSTESEPTPQPTVENQNIDQQNQESHGVTELVAESSKLDISSLTSFRLHIFQSSIGVRENRDTSDNLSVQLSWKKL